MSKKSASKIVKSIDLLPLAFKRSRKTYNVRLTVGLIEAARKACIDVNALIEHVLAEATGKQSLLEINATAKIKSLRK
jgi:hypothetical protein